MMASKEINLEEVERAQTNEDMLDNKVLNQDAKEATAAEHDLNLWQAIKTYRKAVFWSIMVSTSIIMVCKLSVATNSQKDNHEDPDLS